MTSRTADRSPAQSSLVHRPLTVAAVLVAAGTVLAGCSGGSSTATLSSTVATQTAPAGSGTTGPVAAGTPYTAEQLAPFRTVAQDTSTYVKNGQQAQAVTRVKDLETGWDRAQVTLQPQNPNRWTQLDKDIDAVLTTVRASSPDVAAQTKALNTLLADLA